MRFKMIACVLAVALLSAIGSRADERARFLRRQELDAACEHARDSPSCARPDSSLDID
jgi:hypothetical protein